MIEVDKKVLDELYSKYGKTTDDEIRKHLSNIQILKKENKSYYRFKPDFLKEMKERPRSVTFLNGETYKKFELNSLIEWKTVIYLVKSSSRFFLKSRCW